MSLRIAVLGKTGEAGFSIGREFRPGQNQWVPTGDKGTRAGNRCQWIPVPEPLSLEGISGLQHSHGCLVFLPEDSVRNTEIQAGLSEDFRALRAFRGSDALTGQLPVLFLLPKAADCQCPEMARWVQELNRELGQGFGSFHFSSSGDGLPGEGGPGDWTNVPNWLGLARNYRIRSAWSTIRALFTVFCLASFLCTLICGAILLLRNTQLGDLATVQRLEFGLIPPKDTLFRVNSLEPMVARLEELQVFLDTHPNLGGERRARLVECQGRLGGFVSAILETADWAEVSDLSDMPGLRELAQSLKAWTPPKCSQMAVPLVEKAEAKRHQILDAWARAQQTLPVLEGRLAKADLLLNQENQGPETWGAWANNCAGFLDLADPLDSWDPLWLLEEFIQARQSLLARKTTISGAVELASGLGLLNQPNTGPGPFYPLPDRGESLGKVPGIRDIMFKSAGKGAEAFFSKLGPALGDSLKDRCGECRKEWLKIGKEELKGALSEGLVSRNALQVWVEKARNNQSLKGYGEWVEWLGEFAFKGPGKKIPAATRNPIVGIEQFVALESVNLRPNRCRLTVSKDDARIEGEPTLDLTVMDAGSSTDYSSEGVRSGPGLWDFMFRFQGQDNPGITWGWNQSLRLRIKEKSGIKSGIEITAVSPADAGKLMGDNVFGLVWNPMPDGFPIPELLLP